MDVHHDQTGLFWKLVAGLVCCPSATEPWGVANRNSSQAMDVGTLKSLPADTIRIIVWVLSFLTFGFATGEFEVTADRLGTYRPEEHIEYVITSHRLPLP